MSKIFGIVWRSGLLFKLKVYRIESELLALHKDYFDNREQRELLNGQMSERRKINPGGPQMSVLGPLLLLTNDLPDGITLSLKIFAGNTSLFSKIHDIDIHAKELNSEIKTNSKWASQSRIQFNYPPSKRAK